MKKLTMTIIILACLALALPATAQTRLSASIEGDELRVTWSGAPAGDSTLTLYVDGWPMSVCRVGSAGEKRVALGGAKGTYSARLATPGGCVTARAGADASAAQPAAPAPIPAKAPAATARPTGTERGDLASEVVRQVNAERAKAGLSQLRVDLELTRAARVRAEEIVRKFSHTRPDGSGWSTVSASAYGENIAMGQRTADKVMAAWLTSAGHRANILRPSFGSIGVCAVVVDGVTYWAQLFGK